MATEAEPQPPPALKADPTLYPDATMREQVTEHAQKVTFARERHETPVRFDFKNFNKKGEIDVGRSLRQFLDLAQKVDPTICIQPHNKNVALIESSDRFPQTEESFNNAFRPSIVTAANNQKIVQVFLSFVSEKRFSEIKRDSNVFGFLFKYRIFLQYEASHGNPTSGIGFLSHVHPRLVWREDAQRELIARVETYVTPTEKENLEKRVNEINAQRGSFPQIKAQGKFPLPIHLMTRSIGVGSGKNRYETQALEVQVPRGTGELMKQLFIRLQAPTTYRTSLFPTAASLQSAQQPTACS
jgi:hypothetical protein